MKYIVIDDDGDQAKCDTLEDAMQTADEWMAKNRDYAQRDGQWPECCGVRVLEVVKEYAIKTTGRDADTGEDYADYIKVYDRDERKPATRP